MEAYSGICKKRYLFRYHGDKDLLQIFLKYADAAYE